jgi:hypothetical protein
MWTSRKQSSVSLSSTEAELFATSEATKQALFIRKFVKPLKLKQDPIPIYNDNQSTLIIATKPQQSYHAKLKHSDVKIKHIQDSISKQLISLHYCPTEEMPADIFTKPLPQAQYIKLRNLPSHHFRTHELVE